VKIEDNVLSVADDYDNIFVDIYGVLFDGVALYDQAASTLGKLKKKGKKVTILSNTTQVSSEAIGGYSRRGMIQGIHYDEFVTSGEFLNYFIKNYPEEFSKLVGGKADAVECIFMGNSSVFKGTHLKVVFDTNDADFLYAGTPRCSYGAVRVDDVFDMNGNKVNIEEIVNQDWHRLHDSQGRKGFPEIAHQLEYCLRMNKTILVANPDIFINCLQGSGERISIITQGAIGAYYERLGGKVVYFGKPWEGMFRYAQQLSMPQGRMLMVGDTPWTDIIGANNCGWDAALVIKTGVTGGFMNQMDSSLTVDDKCEILLNKIAPKMSKIKGAVVPKYFLKKFAHIG